MRRALLVLALLGAPLVVPAPGAAASGACPDYEHDQWSTPDGAYFVTFDHIVCRDASGTRHFEILALTQGDPHENTSVTLARVEHAWVRDGTGAGWSASEDARAGGATNASASARDDAAPGLPGGACAARARVTEGAFGAEGGTPTVTCPAPWMFLL